MLEKPAAAIPPAFRKAPGDVSPETLTKVREFLVALAGIAGGLKIYPPEHASIAAARVDAWAKLQTILETQWELELTVEETSFQFAGETVYAETNLLKSLPYLMFKDGLRTLSFKRELTEPEFLDLLGILRQVVLLPPEEGDIVALLWERDFEHISYLDSDDYLEAKIGAVERRSWDRPVDPAELAKGRIDLRPEDVAEIVRHSLETATVGTKDASKEAAVSAADAAALARNEAGFLESAFGAERSIPAETSFLDIFSELLGLEDRPAALASMLQFADKHHQELLQRDDFVHAGLLLARLDGLRSQCSEDSPIKVQDLERLSYRIKDAVSLAALKDDVLRGRVDDAAAFFAYLQRIGPRAVPLAAELFEEMEDGIFRSEAFVFLESVGRRSLDALAGLARDTMPFLSKGVVNLLGRTKDRKAVPYLARFKDSRIKAVRLEAVKALLEVGDDLALKIVKSFETDPDPEVREAARRGAEPGRVT
ncbi:MAG: HEAT repeat domain-containing protein [Candidatus Aminicenantes bacterium]|nr:HEAT repeat domain-containing protein [Candidatus Aminicenantes bacterium]